MRMAVPDATRSAETTQVGALKAGDHVRVTLQNGDVACLTLTRVEADAIVGTNGRRVLYRDMSRLEVRHFSKVKTGVLIGVVSFWGLIMIAVAVSGPWFPVGTI
jgi:hypothetical protein